MRRSTWLRIAAIVTLLYAFGHTSGFPWTPATGPNEQPVVDAMQHVHFTTFGALRSYWDYYQGFGLAVTGYLLALTALTWQLASLAKAAVANVRPQIAALLFCFLFNAVIVAKYFFLPPAILVVTIAICLGIALVARPDPSPAPER